MSRQVSFSPAKWCIDRDCTCTVSTRVNARKRSNTRDTPFQGETSRATLRGSSTRNPFCASPTRKNDLLPLSLVIFYFFFLHPFFPVSFSIFITLAASLSETWKNSASTPFEKSSWCVVVFFFPFQ